MTTPDHKDLSDKNWNNEKPETDLNEGFSGKNIPGDYNPKKDLSEKETDSEGNEKTVDRARNATQNAGDNEGAGLSEGKNPQQLKTNEDHNYDDASRYPNSSPENKKPRAENP